MEHKRIAINEQRRRVVLKEKCHINVLKETYHIGGVVEMIESKRIGLKGIRLNGLDCI